MRRPSLHGAGEFVSATWEMINGNFFECAAEPPTQRVVFVRASSRAHMLRADLRLRCPYL